MKSLTQNMNLKKVCLTVGCVITFGLVSLAELSAGAVPWTFNALFGPSRNGPRAYYSGYAPRSYTSNYGGYAMAGSNTSYYAPARNRAQARRSSRAAYRWYLINNPQVVGAPYNGFAGGSSYQFAGASYGPGCCSPCGLSGCSTGNCATGNCSSGQCGVNYGSSTSSTPVPDPNAGGKVPEPREVEDTPPRTFANEPMPPAKAKSNVEDSGFGARSYKKEPMPKDESEDLFKTPFKADEKETPPPTSKIPADDFGTEKPKSNTEKKDDFFGPSGTKSEAFKVTPDGKIPKTTIPQKKTAPTKKPADSTPKAEQETNLPPLRVQPLNLDQKITWKSAPKAERLTIRAHFSAPVIAKQDVPTNSGWFAITESPKIASK